MSLELPLVNAEPGLECRNIRINKWISALPHDLSRHQRLSSLADPLARADSPLLGFAPQESASYDPLHHPSPDYVRRLPEEVTLTKESPPLEKSFPALPSEDAEQDINFPTPVARDPPRHPAHLSFTRSRPPITRQPSLPIFTSTRHSYLRDSVVMPRIRSNSTAATPMRADLPLLHTRSSISHMRAPPSTPLIPTGSLGSDLERQKLNALFIASGLAEEEESEEAEAEVLGCHSSSSQVYLGQRTSEELPTHLEPAPLLRPRASTHGSDDMNSTYPSQTISSPRTSVSLDDLDGFDEDASYYGREMNPLFSPYYSPPPSISRNGEEEDQIVEPAASKWSLSSSIKTSLDKSRRGSPAKSIKNKREKLRSFISRFAPHGLPNKHGSSLIAADARSDKFVRRERSHSDVLDALTGRGSVSSRIRAVGSGSWESVPPTPTTAESSTTASGSTSCSPVTPNDNEGESRDEMSAQGCRVSEEKLAPGPGLSRLDSHILSLDTSAAWSGSNTTVPSSPVDTVTQPPLRLSHAMSTPSLKMNGLKGLASKIGLAPLDGAHEEEPKPVQPPKTFKERMILKNNGSALSLILGKGINKTNKHPKRKLLISGIERGDLDKYEAISSWCEGFGSVKVKQAADGSIVADFHDASVAETVCRLQARVSIKGAGSVVLSWTTRNI